MLTNNHNASPDNSFVRKGNMIHVVLSGPQPETASRQALAEFKQLVADIRTEGGKNLGDARNSQRSADVTTIINGVYQYSIDNNGSVPAGITTTATEICATGAASCTGLVDLSALTTAGKYLVSVPKDPQCSTVCATNGTGYKIAKDANGRLIVNAPSAEQSKTISVTR